MSHELIIASSSAGKDSDQFFIQFARACCEMSIKNTAVGKWLGQSLDRLETAAADVLTAEQTGHKWFKLASNRRFEIERLQAENERLRDGLRDMVSYTAVYGEKAGERAAELLADLGGDDE